MADFGMNEEALLRDGVRSCTKSTLLSSVTGIKCVLGGYSPSTCSQWFCSCVLTASMGRTSVEQDSLAYSEWDRLFDEFAAAIAEIFPLQVEHTQPFRSPDPQLTPVAILLKRAEEKKRDTKDALVSYI